LKSTNFISGLSIGDMHDDVTFVKPHPLMVSLHRWYHWLLFMTASSISSHYICSMTEIPI